MRDQPATVFLVPPPEPRDARARAALARRSSLALAPTTPADRRNGPSPILFLLDEFATLGRQPPSTRARTLSQKSAGGGATETGMGFRRQWRCGSPPTMAEVLSDGLLKAQKVAGRPCKPRTWSPSWTAAAFRSVDGAPHRRMTWTTRPFGRHSNWASPFSCLASWPTSREPKPSCAGAVTSGPLSSCQTITSDGAGRTPA